MAEIVTMPKLGFDMAEGTLVRWVIQEGEPVAKGSILAEIETDKATVEVESAYQGILSRHFVATGEVVPVNAPIAVIAAPGEKVEQEDIKKLTKTESVSNDTPVLEAQKAQSVEAQLPQTPALHGITEGRIPGGIKASPLARRMADNMRINLSQVKGSGPGGRVLMKDVKAFIEAPSIGAKQPPSAELPTHPGTLEATTPTLVTQSIPIPRLRAIIGRRMTEAKQQIPHFYVTHEYDVDALIEMRKQFNALVPEEEAASINDFIIKGTAMTLRQFPNLNASLKGNQIVLHSEINVGVAVAVENGLLTVVCRDADRKPLPQVANEVRTMIERARAGKVRPEDIEGSTFSVSNLGMFDVEHFIAIINPPEAAVLAVGSARKIPVVKDGQVTASWRMKATISVDHRISDGVEAARFLQTLAVFLEQPLRLLL